MAQETRRCDDTLVIVLPAKPPVRLNVFPAETTGWGGKFWSFIRFLGCSKLKSFMHFIMTNRLNSLI